MQNYLWEGLFQDENNSTTSEASLVKIELSIEILIEPFKEKL